MPAVSASTFPFLLLLLFQTLVISYRDSCRKQLIPATPSFSSCAVSANSLHPSTTPRKTFRGCTQGRVQMSEYDFQRLMWFGTCTLFWLFLLRCPHDPMSQSHLTSPQFPNMARTVMLLWLWLFPPPGLLFFPSFAWWKPIHPWRHRHMEWNPYKLPYLTWSTLGMAGQPKGSKKENLKNKSHLLNHSHLITSRTFICWLLGGRFLE